MEWKSTLPPKDEKFIFSYWFGIGIGQWGQCFTVFNGNSERTHEAYILVLHPQEMVGNQGIPFEWDDEKMIEMEVKWMPLPIPPKEPSP